MNNSRNKCIDVQKGILAILVILGHTILHGSSDNQLNIEEISISCRVIYSFHMPLFMMISGFYTAKSYRRQKTGLIVNRIVLLYPCLVFALFSSCINYKDIFAHHSVKFFLKELLVVRFLINFWFVWAIVILTAVVVVCNYLIHIFWLRLLSYLIIISFCLCFLSDSNNIGNYVFMMPYMFIGFEVETILREHKKLKVIYQANYCGIVLAVMSLLLLHFYRPIHFIHEGGCSFVHKNLYEQLLIDMVRWSAGLVVGAFCLWITIKLYSSIRIDGIYNVLSKIGQYSLEIYILHAYLLSVLKLMCKMNILHYSFFLSLIECAVILSFTLFLIFILKKLDLYKYIFMKKKIVSRREMCEL